MRSTNLVRSCLTAAAAVTLAFGGPSATAADPVPGINALGHRMMQALTTQSSHHGTILVSPLSVATLAALVAAGSDPPRRQAVTELLGLSPNEGSLANAFADLDHRMPAAQDVTLSSANGIWVNSGVTLNDAYRGQVATAFGAMIESRDFGEPGTVETINRWVADQTEGMIAQVFDQLDPAAAAVAANALYFHGAWQVPFDPERTASAPFHNASGDQRTVQMMHLDSERLRYAEDGTAQVIELPFGTGDYMLVIALPKAADNGSETLVRWLAGSGPDWTDTASAEQQLGSVSVPAMSISAGFEITALLVDLGIDLGGSYPGIADPAPSLSAMVHKAAFEMDEEGAKAAAVTAAIFEMSLRPTNEFTMVVDRPFAFAIRHAPTGLSVFLGAVFDLPDAVAGDTGANP